MIKYSEQALKLKALKDSGMSIADISDAENLGRSKVSRLLKLLSYSDDIIEKVDLGQLPLAMPEKADKKKKKPVVLSKLSDNQESIIELAFNKKFLTYDQLRSYLSIPEWKLRSDLSLLVDLSFLKIEPDLRPYIYSVTSKGANRLGVDIPKRWVSSSAMHQYVLRNQISIDVSSINKTMRFIPRAKCWELGLYPSHGEHFIEYQGSKGGHQIGLILVDDYLMSSSRINKSYSRKHNPPKSIYSGLKITASDIVDVLLVYSTDEKRVEKHRRYYSRFCKEITVPVDFRYVKPFWSVS